MNRSVFVYKWLLPEIIGYSTRLDFVTPWGVDENRLKRCLKGVIRGEGWISTLLGGGGFLLVSQVCVTSFVSGKWRRTRRGNGIRRNQESLHLSSDVSVMEETIQSLPQELRTLHLKRWSTENVFEWVTGWGFSFRR